MNWKTKRFISILLVTLFVFTNTASAIQHYDILMGVNGESYIDEGAQTIDYFVNQNSVDISGKIYDPDSEITNLTFNISNESSNISKEVDYLGETDQNGFKDFTVTYDITEDNTVYNSVYAIATNSINETFEVSLFDEFENTIKINSITVDKEKPYLINNPEFNSDFFFIYARFEVNEEVVTTNDCFTLYDVNMNPISNAIVSTEVYKDGDKYFLEVKIDKEILNTDEEYLLESNNQIADLAGNLVDESLVGSWQFLNGHSQQYKNDFNVDTELDMYFTFNNSNFHGDDATQTSDVFLNIDHLNDLVITGNVYDPISEMTSLALNFNGDEGNSNVDLILETDIDELGFRKFRADNVNFEQISTTKFYDISGQASTGVIASIGYLPMNGYEVQNVILDMEGPSYINGPKLNYDQSIIRVEFEINEQIHVDKTNFALFQEDGITEVIASINNAYSFEDNEKFILVVELDRDKIVDYTNYILEIDKEIKDIAGNVVSSTLAKRWIIEQLGPVFESSTIEYLDNKNPEIELYNINNNVPITVQGTSVALDENGQEIELPIDFKVVFNQEHNEADNINYHKLYGHFENKDKEENYLTSDESLEGQADYVFTAIPVDVTKRNKITLSYDVNTEIVFYWEPSEVNLWSHVHNVTHTINNNPIIDIVVGNFAGDVNSLSLQLVSQDGLNVIGQLNYTQNVTSEADIELGEDEEVYRFSYENGTLNIDFTDKTLNNQHVPVKLVYDENNDGVFEETQLLNNVRIDNQSPNPHAWFEAIEVIDNIQYYVLKVNFEDNVLNSTIIESNFELTEDINEVGINPSIVEPIGDINNDFCWEAKLYFTENDFRGNNLIIRNIEDTVGFSLTEKIVNFGLHTHISGNILDKAGNVITDIQNAEIVLIPQDFEITNINLQEDIYKNIQWIHIENNGAFDSWIEPGNYKVLSLIIRDELNDKSINIEQDIEIPYSNGNETFNFNIQIPEDNVYGKVYREAEESHIDKLRLIETKYLDYVIEDENDEDKDGHDIFKLFAKTVETDEAGIFSLYLAPGEYKVLGKEIGFTFVKPAVDYVFIVGTDGTVDLTNNELNFPKTNVIGNVLDGVNSLGNAHIAILNENGEFYETMTNDLGGFEISLNDGNYTLAAVSILTSETVNGGLYFVNKPFEVLNGQIVLVNNGNNPLTDIQLPQSNLEIRVIQNGEILNGDAGLDFEFEYQGMTEDAGTHTRTGIFELYLMPGVYLFDELFVYNKTTNEHMEIKDLNLEIIIDETSSYVNENAIEIDISDLKANSSNTVITFEDEEGNPLSGYGFSVHGTADGATDERTKTDSNGKAYLNLQPGIYKIPGYDVENEGWKELNYEFEVFNTNTIENKLNITVVIKAPNVKGSVLDEEGNTIPYAWVSLEKLPDSTDGEYFNTHMSFNTNDLGEFTINLEAGEYYINGIWNPSEDVPEDKRWNEMNFKFYVVEVEGNLEVRLTPNGENLSELIVKKQPDNIQGFVYKKYINEVGEPFNGNSEYESNPTDGSEDNYNNVWLVLRESGISEEEFSNAPWLYEKWVHVESDGRFSVLVDDTKVYEAFAISTPRKYIELNQNGDSPILIQPPVTDLIITPPEFNFGGQLLDFEGNPIAYAHVGIEKSDYSNWYGTETDEEGYFGLSLKNGEEYIIRDVFYYTGDKQQDYDYTKENRITFNKKLTIDANSNNIVLRPNIKGNLDIGEIETSKDSHVNIGIRKIVNETDENYNDYIENMWKYESWINAKYENGSNVGEFIGSLGDGEYEIIGINSSNGWKQLGINFTLDKSSHDIVAYDSNSGNYELNINYSPNVQGLILDQNNIPVKEAWVNIERIVEEQDYETGADYDTSDKYNRWFGTNTDENGEFGLKLDDGYYKITGYYTNGYWEDNTWINGKFVSVNYEFTVLNGELQNNSSITIKPNVTGFVKKYNKDTGNLETVKYSWMKIKSADENFEVDYSNWIDDKWANSDDNGEFTLMLQPGKYKVVEAGGNNVWMQLSINFEIDNEGNLVPNDYVENGQLIIKPQKANVKGYIKDENGNILSNSHISIKPLEAKEHDWSNAKWINSDDNGYFELKLDDGDWKITEISAPGFWQRVYIPFTITGEDISSTMNDIIVNGKLEVKPTVSNLVGIVKDKDGNVINEKAWLSIKPSNSGTHDWENAHWVEYKNYDGEYKVKYYLQPGDYKVVNVQGRDFGYETDIRFTIGNDGLLVQSDKIVNGQLVIAPLEPNVEGIVYGEIDATEQELSYSWLSIARFDNEGNQLTIDGNEIQEENNYSGHNEDGIYWHHTKGINTNESGEFELRLAPGLYKVINVSGNGVWYKANTEFEVVEGQKATIEVRQPGPNTMITIRNTGLADTEAWIDVEIEKDNNKYYVPFKLKSVDSGEYVFETRLENGDYKIRNFGTPSYGTEIEHKFTVNNEESLNDIIIDFNQDSKKKATGQINKTGVAITEKAWISILPVIDGIVDTTEEKRWIQTSEDGSFTFKLEEGEQWVVTDVTTSDGYFAISNPLDYSITVGSSDEQSPNEWIIDIDLIQ